MDDAVFHRPDRDVLLHGGVGGARERSRSSAPPKQMTGNARVLNLGNDVTAMLAKCKTSDP